MSHIGVAKVRLALVALLVSTVTVIGGAAGSGAVAAAGVSAESVAVEIVGTRARIGKDGAVAVRIRNRCPATFQAFEMNVSVVQGNASGYFFKIGPPDVMVCDGRWHQTVVKVAPSAGKFRKGLSDVEVAIQYYDTVQGNDAVAGAGGQLRLVRC